MPLDEEAIARIYAEHAPMLRRMIISYTHDPGRAEDLVQEIILRVWRRAPEPDNLRSYLLQCTRNSLIDNHRRTTRRPLESPEQDWPSSSADIDAALDRLLIAEALARLRPEHRQVIDALHYRRLTVAGAATAIGIPEGTVKSRAFYALRQLRMILDEMGVHR